jgi:uncharacterized DUF497 family protein
MIISYDPDKSARNQAERGLPFDLVVGFEWSTAVVIEDVRKDHGEQRFRVLGYIGERLHALVFTPRGDAVHVISLRKANVREVKKYEQN